MSTNFQIVPSERPPFYGPVFQPRPTRLRLQRISLSERITAELGSEKAIIIDISLSGVLLAHEQPRQEGQLLNLIFDSRGETIRAEVEVMRTEIHRPAVGNARPLYRTGVAFRRFFDSSERILRQMITDLVERALDERRANARGVPPHLASYVRSGKIRGYLKLRYLHGIWQRVETGDPIQPRDGFTVSIDEDPAQIKVLCQTYEKLAEADRSLVREMAALSIANPHGIPARRYDP